MIARCRIVLFAIVLFAGVFAASPEAMEDYPECPSYTCVGCYPDPGWGNEFCKGPYASSCSQWECEATISNYCVEGGGQYKLCYCPYCI